MATYTAQPVGEPLPYKKKKNILGSTTMQQTDTDPNSYTPALGTAERATSTGYDAAQGTAANYDASNYSADTRDVKSEATVEGRLGNILNSESPLMKQAETTGLQLANKRGVLNSSMAIGAAQGEMIKSALPIASQDASTLDLRDRVNMDATNQERQFNTSADNVEGQFNATNDQQMELTNTDATNRASEFGANAQNNVSQFNAAQENQITSDNVNAINRSAEFNIGTIQQERLQRYQQDHEVVMAKLDDASKQALVELEMDYKQIISQEKNSTDAYLQAMSAMSQALSNGELSAEQQQRAVSEITSQLSAFLSFNQQLTGIEGVVPNSTQQTNQSIQDSMTQALEDYYKNNPVPTGSDIISGGGSGFTGSLKDIINGLN